MATLPGRYDILSPRLSDDVIRNCKLWTGAAGGVYFTTAGAGADSTDYFILQAGRVFTRADIGTDPAHGIGGGG